MASRVVTVYIDDLDGKEIQAGKGGPLSFALDGQEYEIDLSDKNAAVLRQALRPYIEAAHKLGRKSAGQAKKRDAAGPSAAELRAWAHEQGMDVPTRGRIPGSVREAWAAR